MTAQAIPQPVTGKGGDAATTKSEKKTQNRERVITPTPQEWAEQQLKHAPLRSEEWAKRVARIYGLTVDVDEGTEAR